MLHEAFHPANIEQWQDFASDYDDYRPHPPAALIDLLCQFARITRPKLVVDLGCGTGLATRLWAGRAHRIVGIEPGAAMRQEAERRTTARNIRYWPGYGHATGLIDQCADIVTAAQALHWMPPAATTTEIARILRPGGVFAQIDFKWPPAVDWEVEQAFLSAKRRANMLARQMHIRHARRWGTRQHMDLLQTQYGFRYYTEIALHDVQYANASQLVGLAKTDADIYHLIRCGISEAEIGLTALREIAERIIGNEPAPWYLTYRVRLTIR